MLPTGVHLSNPRELLFGAGERVLARDGVSGLTSRAVTVEASVAKGVMHHHFADFDAFLADLVLDRVARLDGPASALRDAAGRGTLADNLAEALGEAFTPLAVAMVALVVTRDGLRARLRDLGAARFPLLAEVIAMVSAYLAAEQEIGRVAVTADIETLSCVLVGSVHLLFTDRESGRPDAGALRKAVAAVLGGVPGPRGA